MIETSETTKKFMTAEQIYTLLGISRNTFYRKIAKISFLLKKNERKRIYSPLEANMVIEYLSK